MKRYILIILICHCVCMFRAVHAAGFTTATMYSSHSSQWSAPQTSFHTGAGMPASSAFSSGRSTSAFRTSYSGSAGMQLPAQAITHSNLDNAFAESEYAGSPNKLPRRNERDEPRGPSDPGMPVGTLPWAFMACLLAAYALFIRFSRRKK